jgi:leucyl aminopeptidase
MKLHLTRRAPKASVTVRPMTLIDVIPDPARADGFTAEPGQACELWHHDQRTLLVGVGIHPTEPTLEQAGALAAARLAATPRIALDARGLAPHLAASFALGACLRGWRPWTDRQSHDPAAPRLTKIDLLVDHPHEVRPAWDDARAVLRGVLWARRAVTLPSNHLTPKTFCARLKKLERHGLAVEILKPDQLRHAGFGALLAVGQAAANTPRLAILKWRGALDAPPIAFVGKGITFDTGGLCIKPADKMWEMRADMAGAAACVGAMIALAKRGSDCPAIAVLPLAENATGAAAYRPGDVLGSVNGTTIEVVDTDAEGRLVLADALAWVTSQGPLRAVIDLATLTGSIITALGHHRAGLFDNDAALAMAVSVAGDLVAEPVWRMPIGARHREDLNSDIADLRHCTTGRLQPDACHAAAFLREFVGDTPWAHLDIAGMESRTEPDDRHPAGPTAFGTRLLDRLTRLRYENPDE